MDPFAQQRELMVERQISGRGVSNPLVLDAFLRVPRHEFVPSFDQDLAYVDSPLPISHGQTISQPYIVALMTELIVPSPDARILEIGTGSGYQSAILATIVREVYTIEVIPELQESAREHLDRLGFSNIHYKVGDGYFGWPEEAPFDGILVAAASADIPEPLLEQLVDGGRMIIPVGTAFDFQTLKLVRKKNLHFDVADCGDVCFVPFQHHDQKI